jgi:hypothetical protein
LHGTIDLPLVTRGKFLPEAMTAHRNKITMNTYERALRGHRSTERNTFRVQVEHEGSTKRAKTEHEGVGISHTT